MRCTRPRRAHRLGRPGPQPRPVVWAGLRPVVFFWAFLCECFCVFVFLCFFVFLCVFWYFLYIFVFWDLGLLFVLLFFCARWAVVLFCFVFLATPGVTVVC